MSALGWFRGSRRRRIFASACGVVALAVAVLASGYLWFLHLTSQPSDLPPHADGIVAFTGGAGRVETALRLLAENRADRLLLSGIGGGAELTELAHRTGRVTLGRNATTTRGNAQETAAWVDGHDIHSLIVVTASYHMPRALTELGRALPGVTLYPAPVHVPENARRPGVPLRIMVEEYGKFLAAELGLTGLLPAREAPPAHAGRSE